MHPEIQQKKPGRCPQCGMKLVLQNEVSSPMQEHGHDMGLGKTSWKSYMPLIVIISLILLTSIIVSWNVFHVKTLLSSFMIGFFLVFSGFKLMDLPGFAQGYYTYDLLAKRFFAYGYIYPFIELFFGLGMILFPVSRWLLIAELVVMLFSGLGVAIKLAKKEKFQCACLGTFLKVPLTKVTLVEDFGMALLALILLVLK